MEKIFRYQLYPLSLALNYMYLFIEQRFSFFFFHLDQILSCDASTNLLKKTSETRLSSHASVKVLPTPKPVQYFRPSPPYSPDRIIHRTLGFRGGDIEACSRLSVVKDERKKDGDRRLQKTFAGYISNVKFQDQSFV